jgi:hypothetical protein
LTELLLNGAPCSPRTSRKALAIQRSGRNDLGIQRIIDISKYFAVNVFKTFRTAEVSCRLCQLTMTIRADRRVSPAMMPSGWFRLFFRYSRATIKKALELQMLTAYIQGRSRPDNRLP